MFLNGLKRGPIFLFKSYELNQLHALYTELQCISHWWLLSKSTPCRPTTR